MMKKFLIIIGLIIILVGTFIFYNKLYYPSLPIDNMSKKEVIDKLNDSNEMAVKLLIENGHIWFIVSERNIQKVDDIIKEMVSQHGWIFNQKEGSSLFFEKQGKKLIVSTQKWTANYALVKIPMNLY